jgi:hypothetical protein
MMLRSRIDKDRPLMAPRNMQIIITKYFSLFFLLTGIVFCIIFIKPLFSGRIYRSDYIALLISAVFSVIGTIIWHIPERYRTYLIFDKQNNLLKITKKGRERDVKLHDVKKIISKTIGSIGEFKHLLILDNGDSKIELFNEQCCYRGSQWVVFSENLSTLIGLPVTKEHWVVDFNGKFRQITPQEHASSKRHSWEIVIIGLSPFAFAMSYKLHPSRETFYLYGVLNILVFICSPILLYTKDKTRVDDLAQSKKLMIIYTIMSALKVTILYVFFSFLFNGAKLPGIIR